MRNKDNVQAISQHISNCINELKEESQIIKRKLTQLESAKNNLGKEEITMQYSVVLKKDRRERSNISEEDHFFS